MNGVNGARRRATVESASCSVACGAGSVGLGAGAFQKRARERRTYQLERSSTKRSRACAPRSASKPSSASVTVAMVPWRRERTQRSSTWVDAAVWVTGAGVQPSRFA